MLLTLAILWIPPNTMLKLSDANITPTSACAASTLYPKMLIEDGMDS